MFIGRIRSTLLSLNVEGSYVLIQRFRGFSFLIVIPVLRLDQAILVQNPVLSRDIPRTFFKSDSQALHVYGP